MPKMKRTDPSTLGPKYIESRDAVKDVWGERKPFRGFGSWPSRVDYNLVVDEDQVDEWKASACVMCSIGCGIDIAVKDKKIVGVRGREHDRVNRGRLGPKGMYAWQSMASKDRLTHPLIRNKRTGELEKATWDEAMSLIVEKAKDVQKRLTSHGIGFYTSGQLFLEEYVTLACIGKAGLGTLHMDGNTRLCTATAAATMRESFGVDAQPSSYADIDECDVLCLLGHNPAETGTILWDRMLDRLESETPPKLVCIDPRYTAVAAKATIWLQPKNGTNMALMNGIQRELVKNGWYDQAYIDRCVVDFEHLKEVIEPYTPEYVEKITDVPAGKLRAAAKIMGEAERLLSTCLQGVYQANQATATGCQLNNIALMRGMIGKPGAGVLQMNGQPTAQNNRESGCDGEYPAMRNFNNPEHMASLAKAWNIELDKLPYHGNPTHINDLYNFLENGSIEMFWISCTNPLVSMTDTDRMRRILTQPNLFVVTQDIFPNETTQIADVVLPAAGWGEKHGTFTNVDRTVHISEKATEPPGEARADLDIFIDFATRMDFRDKDGNPLIHYKTPEGAFEMWRKVTHNMICDYSGISYEKLRHTGSGGIQWPCNEVTAPNGTVRMYSDGVFPTTVDKIQTWTSDCETGVPLTKEQFLKLNANGKAIFKASPYYPYEDMPDEQYPLAINPGRRTAHFHTRTKTSRTEALHRDLPEAYGEINPKDAEQYGGIKTGDEMIIRSRHGVVQVKALVSENVSAGQIFIPFHFGNYDSDQYGNRAQCANELTKTSWDPISKQPHLKSGAASIEKVPDGQIKIHSKQPEAMERARIRASGKRDELMKSENRVRHLEDYLGLWGAAIKAWREMATQIHKKYESTAEYEIVSGLPIMLILEERARKSMEPLTVRYGENEDKAWTTNIGGVVEAVFPDHRRNDKGSFNIMLDLHGLNTLLHMARGYIGPILPAIKALHDNSFAKCITGAEHEYERIDRYLTSQSTVRGPQVLIVPALPSAGSL